MRVSAILVNYNAGAELGRALRSIADECAGGAWEALVVDNASTDGSGAVVAAFAPHARLIANTENVGFARAVNQALREARASRVLVMNPDCRLVAGALDGLEAALARDATCALVGPRILNPDGTEQGSARGDPDMLTGLFGRTAALRRLLPWVSIARRNVVAGDAPPEGRVVDWVSGACMLARRDALAAIDGFDERYFLYWEDADLCRRLRAAGHRIRYVPAATAVHQVGVSSRTAASASIRAFHASAYRYYATHVAPDVFDPRRLLARLLLGARCRWHLRRAGRAGEGHRGSAAAG
jgi:N-acetylglucosaminyl-diphospho-decaprenol L-rhamnosyltransferase